MGKLPVILGNILVRINQNWQRLMPRKFKTHIRNKFTVNEKTLTNSMRSIFMRINEN